MEQAGAPVLSLENISKMFGSRAILDAISLDVRPREVVGIVGPRGSGKRRLLDIVTGIDRPDVGRIYFEGNDVTDVGATQRRRMGLVSHLQPQGTFVTIREALRPRTVEQRFAQALASTREKRYPARSVELIDDTLSMLDLHQFRNQRPAALSAGIRQRVSLGELLIGRPRLIVLDEPFKVLDEATLKPFSTFLRAMPDRMDTAILVSDRSGHARTVCDRLVHLEDGKLAVDGNARKIFINYRRGNDAGFAQALYQHLERAFARSQLFMDVEGGIEPGADFTAALRRNVQACDILLVMIGPRWAEAADAAGNIRLYQPGDWVAVEIVSALEAGKRVVPVLVGGAEMVGANVLPEALRPLCRRQAVRVRPDSFAADAQRLIQYLMSSGT